VQIIIAVRWRAEWSYRSCSLAPADPRVNIDAQDSDGMTSLMRSAENGHISVVELLLQAGADVHLENKNGKNALALSKDPAIIELLQSALLHA
jgi:ankyrin repeat protein